MDKYENKITSILQQHNITKFPLDIISLLDLEGFIIIKEDIDGLSGAIYVDSDKDIKAIIVNKNHSVARRRFTLAHEYGHYILHNGTGGVYAHRDDSAYDRFSNKELDANSFAAQLLMPASEVHELIKDIKYNSLRILAMQEKFGVSKEAATNRLRNMGLFING